jgi:hypothetical protein
MIGTRISFHRRRRGNGRAFTSAAMQIEAEYSVPPSITTRWAVCNSRGQDENSKLTV